MTYTKRVLALLAASTLFMEVYFLFSYYYIALSIRWWLDKDPPDRVMFGLPFFIVAIGGFAFLSRGRRNGGEAIGFLHITVAAVTAVAVAILSSSLFYVIVSVVGSFFGNSWLTSVIPAILEVALVAVLVIPPDRMSRWLARRR